MVRCPCAAPAGATTLTPYPGRRSACRHASASFARRWRRRQQLEHGMGGGGMQCGGKRVKRRAGVDAGSHSASAAGAMALPLTRATVVCGQDDEGVIVHAYGRAKGTHGHEGGDGAEPRRCCSVRRAVRGDPPLSFSACVQLAMPSSAALSIP